MDEIREMHKKLIRQSGRIADSHAGGQPLSRLGEELEFEAADRGDMLPNATRLCNRLADLYRETKRHSGIWESTCYELVEITSDLSRITRLVLSENAELKVRITELKARITRLNVRTSWLEKEWSQLKLEQQRLLLGEIAFLTEKSILRFVMRDVADPESRDLYKIKDLEQAMAGATGDSGIFHNEREKRCANRQWIYFKQSTGWSLPHSRYMSMLKQYPLSAGHPVTDLKTLKEAVRASQESDTFKMKCNNLIHIMEKTNELLGSEPAQ